MSNDPGCNQLLTLSPGSATQRAQDLTQGRPPELGLGLGLGLLLGRLWTRSSLSPNGWEELVRTSQCFGTEAPEVFGGRGWGIHGDLGSVR